MSSRLLAESRTTAPRFRAVFVLLAAGFLSACGGGGGGERVPDPINNLPVAVQDLAVQDGGVLTIDVLANDREPDGEPMTVVSVTLPANGTAQIVGTQVQYTPNSGYTGDDAFRYTVEDSLGGRGNALVIIAELPIMPTANDDAAATLVNAAVQIPVMANDIDPAGVGITIVGFDIPSNGSLTIGDNGTPAFAGDDVIVYTPATGYSGADSFFYEIDNGNGTSRAAVNVAVGTAGQQTVTGTVTKGPVNGATVRLYSIDADGRVPSGAAPVAQTVTDVNGAWSVAVPLPRAPLAVVSSGGSFPDETDADAISRRQITFGPNDTLEGFLPATDFFLALTPYTNAFLIKARNEASGNFLSTMASTRTRAVQAFGFDPATTRPADPANPDPNLPVESRQHALALGGAANVLNELAFMTGETSPDYAMLSAFIRDFSECELDGNNLGGVVTFDVGGTTYTMPSDLDINGQIQRFSNNFFNLYGGLTTTIVESDCSPSGVLPDTTPPVISLLGANPLSLEGGNPYAEPGFSASDDRDGDVTPSVAVTGSVDANVPGSYVLNYDVSDVAGNMATTVMRTVNVVDTTVPVITLLGSPTVTLTVGDGYVDAGASAVDTLDGDLSASIVVTGVVDTSTAGAYTLRYNVTDAAANAAAEVTRLVTVVNPSIPVITVLGSNPAFVEAGGAYVDAGATATDSEDGDLTASIVVTGSVNTLVPGSYSVQYNVTDTDGNAAPMQTRTVIVQDTTPPVITLTGAATINVEAGTSYADPGATASDSLDGDLSGSVIVSNPVDPNAPGSYTVTYDVSDTAGNAAAQVSRTVVVADTTTPVITLLGSNPFTVSLNGTYTDPGVTATDSLDGDITASVVVGGDTVDVNTLGSYFVTYDVSDAAGNMAIQATRTVDVVDTQAPVINLVGANPLNVEAGTSYTDPGATATDNVDGDITASIVVGGDTVDPNTPGAYTVTYDVTDSESNAAPQVARTVVVADTTAPLVTITGASPLTVEAGSSYTEPGATASDSFEGDVTASIVIGGDVVDANTAGTYTVTYDVSDSAGNAAVQATRTVNVVDTVAPAITLVGANPLNVEAGTSYTEPGATASDSFDGDITASLVIGGDVVDANTVGTYYVTYDVSDAAGNAAPQLTRSVVVADTTMPVITLTGANPLNVEAGGTYSNPGATASDSFDGDISGSISVGGDVVDPNTPATYNVTYDVMDTAGNPATQVNRTVVVADTTAPTITLTGANPLNVEAGGSYSDPGATANDSFDGDISGSISVGGDVVDPNTPATYNVTYDVMDAAGNPATQVNRTVVVADTTAPTITLTGANPLNVEAGGSYTDPGATANDSFDGDISGSISVGGDVVDPNTPATYNVTYDVMDAAGNPATQVNRTVVVADTTAPTITLTGANPLNVEAGGSYTDPGATANDSFDGDISGSISVGGDVVDPNTPATYNVTYDVMDGAGNPATQVNRTVVVADTVPPVISLNGANPQVVGVGGPYTELGATATDAFDGSFAVTDIDSSGVDVATEGTYFVLYNAMDLAGNVAATVARTVNVVPAAQVTDSDGDGISDALEERITGSTTATQAQTFYIDPDPSITVRDGSSWTTAYSDLEQLIAANAGFVPQGVSAAAPNYVLFTDNVLDPATGGDPNRWRITLASGNCSDIAFIGSLGDGTIYPDRPAGSPATRLNRPNGKIMDATNCANMQFHDIEIFDSGGPVLNGGAISIGTSDAVFDGVVFRNNAATVAGGALEIVNSFSPAQIRNSLFIGNRVTGGAAIGGGAIYLANNSEIVISESQFLDNWTASGSGGAINGVQNSGFDISEGVFSGNDAAVSGGAIFFERNNVAPASEIRHSIFSGNDGGQDGGAIHANCNDFAPSVRFFDNLMAANAATRGSAVAIDDCDVLQVDNNTLVFNGASSVSGGAIHIDTISMAAPNFRPMPELFDNILFGNVDGSGQTAYSINNLPSWGQQESHENLIDHAASLSTKDTLLADETTEFDVAWYLDQAMSQGINLSQVNAANANKFLATPERVTDRTGAADAAKADTGYHYAGAYGGDPVSAVSDTRLLPNSASSQDIVIRLSNTSGIELGAGYRVAIEIDAGSPPVTPDPATTAADPRVPAAFVATDLGNGRYILEVDTLGVSGPDTVTLHVYADGVLVGTLAIPVDP